MIRSPVRHAEFGARQHTGAFRRAHGHNGRWWFNCSGQKQLYYWTPIAGASTFAWVSGGESLSYWEDATNPDLLWSLQDTTGNRNVFAVTQATYGGG